MRSALAALLLLAGASGVTIAVAQPVDKITPQQYPRPTLPAEPEPIPAGVVQDARSTASDHAVGEARRAYRAACSRYEAPGFCECVTAGVAQALTPDEVRAAARTIGERITAQGDAAMSSDSDTIAPNAPAALRIEHVEAHYASACAQFR